MHSACVPSWESITSKENLAWMCCSMSWDLKFRRISWCKVLLGCAVACSGFCKFKRISWCKVFSGCVVACPGNCKFWRISWCNAQEICVVALYRWWWYHIHSKACKVGMWLASIIQVFYIMIWPTYLYCIGFLP